MDNTWHTYVTFSWNSYVCKTCLVTEFVCYPRGTEIRGATTETERPSDWQPLGLSHGRLSGVTRLSAIKPDSPGRHIKMTATAASLSTMVITWSTKRLSNWQPLGLSWDSLGCQTTMTAMDVALSTKVFIWSAMVFIWSALVFTFECSTGHLWWQPEICAWKQERGQSKYIRLSLEAMKSVKWTAINDSSEYRAVLWLSSCSSNI